MTFLVTIDMIQYSSDFSRGGIDLDRVERLHKVIVGNEAITIFVKLLEGRVELDASLLTKYLVFNLSDDLPYSFRLSIGL